MSSELRVELEDDLTVLENPMRSAADAKAKDKIMHNLLHRGFASSDYERGTAELRTRRRSGSVAKHGEKDKK